MFGSARPGCVRWLPCANCFKFRNKVGLDTVVEAIRFYRERRTIKVDDLMRYATVCRVNKIMRPYLEAIL